MNQLSMSNFLDLPKEMVAEIFSYIKWDDVVMNVQYTCRIFWRIVIECDEIWEGFCYERFYETQTDVLWHRDIEEAYEEAYEGRSSSPWRRLFRDFQINRIRRLIDSVERGYREIEKDRRRATNIVKLFQSKITRFCFLSSYVRNFLNLGSSGARLGYGDYCIVGYFFPKEDPEISELGDYGFSSLCNGVYQHPRRKVSEGEYKEYFGNKERKMRNFADFVRKCLVWKRASDQVDHSPDEDITSDGIEGFDKTRRRKVSWDEVIDSISYNSILKPVDFLPLYTERILNIVCLLRWKGCHVEICVEGEYGYYHLCYDTS